MDIAKRLGYRDSGRWKARSAFVFTGTNLAGARVLDVGCGTGSLAIYAAMNGARAVVGVEPESDGSSSAMLATFRDIVRDAGLTNVECVGLPIAEYLKSAPEPFDIIVLYNVINHLDEESVTQIQTSSSARLAYEQQFKMLKNVLAKGGQIIVADSSRYNFWNQIGRKSPLAPSIEWHKHQPPRAWQMIARAAGLRTTSLRWSYLYPWKRLTSNWLVQYLTTSHFVLQLSRD